ncbi:hypothetical protein [uncultured Tenacibaculum sp.]|uniref:hypothetical protein n=1 Tax=uncultured Tenacibaculum sp. TaxID=174713 RepID=UPI002638194B|nr:hypothetical protein [uncultured Tenacibaculum sp.]
MENPYQIFGSKSSVDLDVCFFVDELNSIQENHETIKTYIEKSNIDTNKVINANLAIIEKGIVIACFKGEEDELNNALYETYKIHKQQFEKRIIRKVNRNVEARIERCLRSLVSYFTRTEFRVKVKEALRGSIKDKVVFLEGIQLDQIKDFGKNGSQIEVYKTIAFQLGITLALLESVELYTKEGIIEYYPNLENYLLRKESNVNALQEYLDEFIKKMNES